MHTAPTEIYTLPLPDALRIPTGTVTFTFFTASSACTGASVGSGTVTLDASGVAHPSASQGPLDPKSTRLNSSHSQDSYAVFCFSTNEPLTVTALTPTALTDIH